MTGNEYFPFSDTGRHKCFFLAFNK